MQQLTRVIPVARQLLTIKIDDEHHDAWLWERAARVFNLTQVVTELPEVTNLTADRLAIGTAALFHCAGWITQIQQGSLNRWQVLTRPTNDIQRELGAALLQEYAAHLLSPKTIRLASEAIRQCNDRGTALVEAQLLAEAEGLDDFGVIHVLRQFRQYQAESRPIKQLIATWERQQEYHYWEVRINDGLRFNSTRQLARERLAAVEAFMLALTRDLTEPDPLAALEHAAINSDNQTPSINRSENQSSV
ncbi:MAG: hypothetical protein ABIG44_03295 [Planctomycetota bacterium]